MFIIFVVFIIVKLEITRVNVGRFDGHISQANLIILWQDWNILRFRVDLVEEDVCYDRDYFIGLWINSIKLQH